MCARDLPLSSMASQQTREDWQDWQDGVLAYATGSVGDQKNCLNLLGCLPLHALVSPRPTPYKRTVLTALRLANSEITLLQTVDLTPFISAIP